MVHVSLFVFGRIETAALYYLTLSGLPECVVEVLLSQLDWTPGSDMNLIESRCLPFRHECIHFKTKVYRNNHEANAHIQSATKRFYEVDNLLSHPDAATGHGKPRGMFRFNRQAVEFRENQGR